MKLNVDILSGDNKPYSLIDLREFIGLHGSIAIIIGASLLTHIMLKLLEPMLTYTFIFAFVAAPSILSLLLLPYVPICWTALFISYIVYFTTLSLSVIGYRVSPFHPLAKFPGPLVARISKIWDIHVTLQGKRHIYYQRLHEKYGDYVRVGPNEISVRDSSAIVPLLGPHGPPKGNFYESRRRINTPPDLLSASGPEHSRRRKPWNRAFSTGALKNYEELIQRRALQLRDTFEDKCGDTINLSSWIDYFVFDFMGDFIFGGGFETMKNGDSENMLELLANAVRTMAWSGNVPWLKKILLSVKNGRTQYQKSAMQRVRQRLGKATQTRDLFHYLMGEDGNSDALTVHETIMEGGLAMVAGSDTTSYVLSNLFFYLISNHEIMSRVQGEISMTFSDGELPLDNTRLAHMKLMNAVIDETMRLQPPVLSGSQRKLVPGYGGAILSGHFVAEGTNILLPTYALQRDERYFSPAPQSFWPDRWLPEHERQMPPPAQEPYTFIHDTTAFIPFSYGPTSCVGKNLALQEIRLLTAVLLQRFDFKFAKGFDRCQWDENLKDYYIGTKGELLVELELREKS